MWQCGNYKPDNVMSEEELLEKIREKYKNCDAINKNKSSNYVRNIDDDVLIYEFDLKL
jgi:aerobic-type carbon monoxide dehydrogenase small subunit (CoxS/CutS family)